VKYVVTVPGSDPFISIRGTSGAPPKVHAGRAIDIYDLGDAAPYFEVVVGDCALSIRDRRNVIADCALPAMLVRRELFFPGWRADLNGTEVEIAEYDSLFQRVTLRPGRNELRFSYAPPHVNWAWLLTALGSVSLLVGRRLKNR
jgi:hypothetical protein